MVVRGKFKVSSVTNYATTPGYVYAEVKMDAIYTETPEDNTYAQATPSAQLLMVVTVPEVVDFFKPGLFFYADFTPADE